MSGSEHEEGLQRIIEADREHIKQLLETVLNQYRFEINPNTPIEEVEILPTKDRYLYPKHLFPAITWPSEIKGIEDTVLPKVPINEVFGFPESGKSKVLKHLRQLNPKSVVRDESVYPNAENTPSDVEYFFFLPEKKLMTSIPALRALIEEKIGNVDDGRIIDEASVVTRGPNDVIALLYRYFHGFLEGIPFTSDLEDEYYLSKYAIDILHEAVQDLINIDSVILFYNNLETAQQRRAAVKKTTSSRIVNKEVWPIVEESYLWWLQRIYPILRETYGTGLLVVDGRKGLKENNERVHRYIDSVIQHIPRRDV